MIKVSKNLFIGAIFLIISFFFNTAIVSAGSDFANTTVHVGSGGGGGGVGDGDCRDGIQNGGETGIDTGGRCGTGTGSCPAGTAGTPPNCICTNPVDGDKNCNVPDLSGNLTALSGSCTIPAGENSCPIAFTWTTTGQFFSTSDVRIDGGGSFASGNYSWLSPGHYLDVPYGNQVFALFHGTIRLDREYVSATCASGTWNGSTCGGTLVCNSPRSLVGSSCECPAGQTWSGTSCTEGCPVGQRCDGLWGSLNPASTSCSIPAGASSCSIYATWDSTRGDPTSDVRGGENSLFSGDFGEGNLEVPYGTALFYLWKGTNKLDTASLGASCGAGTWNDSTCSLVVPPTGVLNVQDCEIASGGSTCPMPISFNVSNSGSNAAYVKNANTDVQVGSSGTIMDFTTPVSLGQHDFNLLDSSASNVWLASDSGEAKCAAGTTRVGSICLGAGGYGLYLHDTQPPITGCPIKRGNSSCRIHLGWYITNDGSNRVGWIRQQIPNGNDQINLKLSNASDGYETTSDQNAIGRYGDTTSSPLNGGTTYTFYMHYFNQDPWSDALGRPMATLDYTPVCVSGSVWNGTICSSNTSTLSATNCTIPIGSSTCSSSVSWYVLNPVGSSSVTRTNPNVTVSTAHSGSNVSNAISGANNGYSTYSLFNNNVEVAPRVTVRAICESLSHWSITSSTCVADTSASLTLTATKNQIVKGSSVSLNMNAVGVESCTASSSPTGPFTGPISGTLLGPFWPTKTTTYSVTCTPFLVTQPKLTATAKVIVKEKISEIEQ